MEPYIIWQDEFGNIMLEIMNENEILEVQKEFIEKGYYVIEICIGVFNTSTFMRLRKKGE